MGDKSILKNTELQIQTGKKKKKPTLKNFQVSSHKEQGHPTRNSIHLPLWEPEITMK